MKDKLNDNYRIAAEWIAEADGLLITAGAGMGVDSGLPDFRGKEGFWNAYPGLGKQGVDFIDIANPRNFIIDPELAWGFTGIVSSCTERPSLMMDFIF